MMKKSEYDINKRFHLQIIESTISRMASNSFLIKGWSLTALGGLIALYVANQSKSWSYDLLLVCLGACILFWINDAYYLNLERCFRKLYASVASQTEEKIDFSMDPPCIKGGFRCALVQPVFLFSYGIILIIVLLMLYFLK
ncbi:hypothetical protein R5Q06_03245 [Oenococcus oeni]